MVVSVVTAESTYQIPVLAMPGGLRLKRMASGPKNCVLGLMGQVSMLCNDAELFNKKARGSGGDPKEGELYPFVAKLGMDRERERGESPRIDAFCSSSEHKFMATLHKSAAGKECFW